MEQVLVCIFNRQTQVMEEELKEITRIKTGKGTATIIRL